MQNLRRYRNSPARREMFANVRVLPQDIIQPIFIKEGITKPEEIKDLSNIYRHSLDSTKKEIEKSLRKSVNAFLIFPIPAHKDIHNCGFVYNILKDIKNTFKDDIVLMSDLCLCSTTSHGQCGVLNHNKDNVLNKQTVEILTENALKMVGSGLDCIAPSDMMDGRIKSIRTALDNNGFDNTLVMSYSTKFASNFYGPFRSACDSNPTVSKKGNSDDIKIKDRKTYQIDYRNNQDAMLASIRDESEGADILMVKPVIYYLDIVSKIRQETNLPIVGYHVSGEYQSIELMAKAGLVDRNLAHLEALTAMKRAGCDLLISYTGSDLF